MARKKSSYLVFVNSMSDLFHEDLDLNVIRKICTVMRDEPRHLYQVLTKRAARMRQLLTGPLQEFASLPQIWWGVSVESRRHGLPRIDELRSIPRINRFLSIEPYLEFLGELGLEELHWVITGAESGQGARQMDEDWVRVLRDQCEEDDVPLFYKQKVEKKRRISLPLLDGKPLTQMPDAFKKLSGKGSKICSPGCHRCYAMVMAWRLKGVAQSRIAEGKNPGRFRYYIDVIGDDGRWNGKVVLVPEALDDPRKW